MERSVVNSAGLFAFETWLVQNFHATETFSVDSDDDSVWEQIGLILVCFRS